MKSLISISTSTLVDDVFGLDRIKNFIHYFIFYREKSIVSWRKLILTGTITIMVLFKLSDYQLRTRRAWIIQIEIVLLYLYLRILKGTSMFSSS
jgi:hypothetical protein